VCIRSGSWDGTVRLWDASTGQLLKTFIGHEGGVGSLCYSPDGGTLASGESLDGTVRLWDASTGQLLKTLKEHTEPVNSVCYSPDGGTLASGSWDGTVRLWDASTGQRLKTLKRDTEFVESVCYSPDGGTLASGSWDGTVRLWDASTGQLLKTLKGHTSLVYSVCYSPDGGTLASGSEEGTILLWGTPRIVSHPRQPSLERDPIPKQKTPRQIAQNALAATVLIVMEDANGHPLSTGSGFFVEPGIVATNLHVVEGVLRGYVKSVGMNTTYDIQGILAMDSRQDLALIEVPDIGAPVLPLGKSDEVHVGQSVYVTGNPIGFLEGTFSDGIVSGVREFRVGSERIQITAPISKGSSGGPVLNSKGEVIGVAVSTITAGQNLNFTIPSNYLKDLLDKVRGRK